MFSFREIARESDSYTYIETHELGQRNITSRKQKRGRIVLVKRRQFGDGLVQQNAGISSFIN